MADHLFQPLAKYGKNHAVDLVVAFVKLSKNVSAELFKKLGDAHGNLFAADFPIKRAQQAVSIKLSEGGSNQIRSESLGGWDFHQVDPDSPPRKTYGIEFHQDQISIILGDYERWSKDGPRICDYLARALDALKTIGYEGSINHVGLNVVDIFVLEDISSGWKEGLLNSTSMYLPGFVFKTDNYWHVNSGSFVQMPSSEDNVLNNCNIAAIQVGAGHKDRLKINTSHEVHFAAEMDLDSCQTLCDVYLDAFHDQNKSIVSDVLSKTVAKEIGLI